jgi:hypothetical protein
MCPKRVLERPVRVEQRASEPVNGLSGRVDAPPVAFGVDNVDGIRHGQMSTSRRDLRHRSLEGKAAVVQAVKPAIVRVARPRCDLHEPILPAPVRFARPTVTDVDGT